MNRYGALNQAKEQDPTLPEGFWRNTHPRCPHCGNECPINECELYYLYEEGEHDVDCPHCELEFRVSTHVEYSFSTDEQPGED